MNDLNTEDALPQSGIYGLWLRVTSLSIVYFLKYQNELARDFIFDETNVFFDLVCEQMGYEPRQVRRMILKASKKREYFAFQHPAEESMHNHHIRIAVGG
jgi:hypothetical protein